MKQLWIAILAMVLWANAIAQAPISPRYSTIKIDLQGKDLADLARLGIEVDHGQYKADHYLINTYSDIELNQIAMGGFSYDVLAADAKLYYQQKAALDAATPPLKGAAPCPGFYDYTTPDNFSLGTMGGFFTYQQMLEHLDSMAAKYPSLITTRQPIDSFTTEEGRPIYWLRVSDNPTIDEGEPEILHTALHHAREPGSLSQMIFYLWYLLENYDSDPEIQYLVDNTEQYFVPCVNPDGYLYNQQTDPFGGGYWRKNRRNNGDGNFGVDLNRNYSFNWGYDNQGSSPSTSSAVYRGPYAFSEPETQALQYFCQNHEFQIAQNYHTYGNLLVYSWGYSGAQTKDSVNFRGFADVMTRENNYRSGTSIETVNYIVNGGANDWMYGDTSKAAIFSFVPEVSTFGFWPVVSQIDNLCKSTVLLNLTSAHLLLNYGLLTDQTNLSIDPSASLQSQFYYNLQRYGLANGPLSVSLQAVSSNIVSIGSTNTYQLNPFEAINDSIDFTLSPSIQIGDAVIFEVLVDNGTYAHSETITKVYGAATPVFTEDGNSLSQWSATGNAPWGVTQEDFYSPPSSITDSPYVTYGSSTNSSLTQVGSVDLTNAVYARLRFWGKWDLEDYYDYVQVKASTDGVNYEALCGLYTEEGSPLQDPGEPVYQGWQSTWVYENINLEDYLGEMVQFSFSIHSNPSWQLDGFYFDDLEVEVVDAGGTTSIISLPNNGLRLQQNRPNPTSDYTRISVEGQDIPNDLQLYIYDAFGRLVYEDSKQAADGSFSVSTKGWASGVYMYSVKTPKQNIGTRRMLVL